MFKHSNYSATLAETIEVVPYAKINDEHGYRFTDSSLISSRIGEIDGISNQLVRIQACNNDFGFAAMYKGEGGG